MTEIYNEAVEDLTKAIRLNPTDALSYSYRGMAKFFRGDKEGYCKDFETAIKLGDKNAHLLIEGYCK
jgi:Flp pilus assembly protein TadD